MASTSTPRHFFGAFTRMNARLSDPAHWRGLMAANLEMAFAHPAVERGLAAAIGYCFGGQAVLEQVRAGHQLQAVVSFHGLLHSVRARPRRLSALSVSHSKSICMALLYGRAGRLTAENGGFRPGQ